MQIAESVREARVVHAPDLRQTDLYLAGEKYRRKLTDDEGISTLLTVPLLTNEGTAVGWKSTPGGWWEGRIWKNGETINLKDEAPEGITDVGWVFSFLEQAKLPLSQASSNAPFSTSNPALQLEVHSKPLHTRFSLVLCLPALIRLSSRFAASALGPQIARTGFLRGLADPM